jgi:hypothetical protein
MKIIRYCSVCNELIPEGRLKVLPGARTCIAHSNTSRYSGRMIIHHKTGNELEVIKDPTLAREIFRLDQTKGR